MATVKPIWIYGLDGAPLPLAPAEIILYVDKAGAARPVTPEVVHRFDEEFTILPTDADEAAGTIAIIDCGVDANPRYQVAAISTDANPFAAFVPIDVVGNLAAGAPTIGAFVEIASGTARTSPPVVKAGAHEIYTVTPTAADIVAGVSLRLDAPPGPDVDNPIYPIHLNASFTSATRPTPLAAPATLGEAVVAQLAADVTVVALVGTKMFPNKAPQGSAPPFLVYQVVTAVPENTMSGTVDGRLSSTRLQIDAYAKGYREAHAVAAAVDAVISALDFPELSAWLLSSRDLYDDGASLHRVSNDYAIWR